MTGLQKVSGQITAIDHTKRTLVLKDKDGIITALKWSEGLDGKMQKNKQWFFVTALFIGDVMDDVHYFKKPDDWPQRPQQPGYGGGRPTNTRMIAAQVLLKAYVDLWVNTNTPDQVLFNDAREDIKKAVEEDLEWLMKIGGA